MLDEQSEEILKKDRIPTRSFCYSPMENENYECSLISTHQLREVLISEHLSELSTQTFTWALTCN